ncbi:MULTISPECIES: sensor histidine kinase [Streptomyces]|uniref:histidine kinase n=1 Tax=Streptomyces venezuelae (strain ATCC 10712 / CBS 650.69 / DSM 40230 / JCM 4526 / NBRC 13096 / PD 04745) TaxID=953739 RepID=F2R3U4_STRVP|nr:histidine kinase [Streptomyces venezuelae]APE23938.1 two-component sensor histidine kinase [Streptomyces venezuelae]QES01306.1 two-component sensor histidine kinase [Streptomyces venezuelae ATCC 10712]CCA58316.1 putative two-component system sensor kinase [Streptomyces venezuelae ATCC 10712]
MRLPRPHRLDLIIALAGFATGLLLWSFGLYTTGDRVFDQRWAALVPLAAMASAETLRRTMPRTAMVVGTLALVGDQFTNGNLATVLMYTDVVYAAVVYGSPASARRIPYTTGLITVAITVGFLVWWQNAIALLVGVLSGMISFMPAMTGAVVRNHREAAEAARLRAEQTALLAEMDRSQAVVAERARMARELHDMVANHLSAIAIHSTAALSIDEPATTRQALSVIRENSVAGLSEMRRLIGLLRASSGDAEPAAAPTLAGLDALIDQARANARPSGLHLVLDDTRDSAAGLPAPVELAAYRIVQESLTNALKHAAPGEVRVVLARRRGALTVEVTSPAGERPGPTAPGSGAGLVGMRERVDLLGGVFEAGPVADDEGRKRWRVRAELPVDASDEERA